jgi:hypothetical protein
VNDVPGAKRYEARDQGGVDDQLEVGALGAGGGLHRDTVAGRHDVPGQERPVGLRGQLTVVDVPLEALAQQGAGLVAPSGQQA